MTFMLERLLSLCEKYPLDFISHLSSSLPIVLGLLKRKYLSLISKFIIIFFLFYFGKECFALWTSILKENNLYLQNLEVIVETVIIGFIFFRSFDKFKKKKLIAGFTGICAVLTIFFYKSVEVSPVSLITFRLFSIVLSLSYFNKILTDMRIKRITDHSMFWFVSGLLIFSAGTFFIVLFSEYLFMDMNTFSDEEFNKYWNTSQYLFIVFCLLASYGLWVSKYDRENIV